MLTCWLATVLLPPFWWLSDPNTPVYVLQNVIASIQSTWSTCAQRRLLTSCVSMVESSSFARIRRHCLGPCYACQYADDHAAVVLHM